MNAHDLTIVLLGTILSMQQGSVLSWWDMTPVEVREKINQRIMDIEAPYLCIAPNGQKFKKFARSCYPTR